MELGLNLKYWRDGVLEHWRTGFFPSLHYSNTPSLRFLTADIAALAYMTNLASNPFVNQ